MCDRQIMGVTQIVHAVCMYVILPVCLETRVREGKRVRECVRERETDRGWGADYLQQDRCVHT